MTWVLFSIIWSYGNCLQRHFLTLDEEICQICLAHVVTQNPCVSPVESDRGSDQRTFVNLQLWLNQFQPMRADDWKQLTNHKPGNGWLLSPTLMTPETAPTSRIPRNLLLRSSWITVPFISSFRNGRKVLGVFSALMTVMKSDIDKLWHSRKSKNLYLSSLGISFGLSNIPCWGGHPIHKHVTTSFSSNQSCNKDLRRVWKSAQQSIY